MTVDRRGQVWEIRFRGASFMFLVLGPDPAQPARCHALLNLELGILDSVEEAHLAEGWEHNTIEWTRVL